MQKNSYNHAKSSAKVAVYTLPRRRTAVIVTIAVAALLLCVPFAHADRFDAKINDLKEQNADARAALVVLNAQAVSYQDAINQLQAQIDGLQGAIAANEAKRADLNKQIIQKQAEIDRNREILASALKAMYVDDQMSTIEMLATSKNLSDYVDKEENRATVQSKIQETMAEITKLQTQLKADKEVVDKLLADQRTQEKQLATARAEQTSMLAYNQSQQNDFNAKVKGNNAKIAKLRAQQAAENARLYAGNGSYIVAGNNGNDTYPNKWRNRSMDSIVDNWGMYNRECVSYTAWKVYESGRYMPYWGGHGNAKYWDDNARSGWRMPGGRAIPVSSTPREGDVAVKNAGAYGHVMYVEHVYDDGAIYVSQYNQDWSGHYSEAYISAATVRANDLQFVHF